METNKGTTIITVASGKGGVGKTNLSLNLALSLLEKETTVCLLDADVGTANVDILLGLSTEKSLVDFLEDKSPLQDILLVGPRSLKIIPGGTALDQLPVPGIPLNSKLKEIQDYVTDFDFLIIDASAGISEQVIHYLEAATFPLVVVVPEPTSLTDAYALLKMYSKRGHREPVHIVVNQAKSSAQAKKVFEKLRGAANKHLNLPVELVGHVLEDPQVKEAVSRQTPFVELFPDAPASSCIKEIASAVLSHHVGSTRKAASSPSSGEQPAPPPSSSDVIDLLLKEGSVSPAHVEYAKKIQSRLDVPKRLLTILQELGHVREEKVKDTLRNNRTKIRLGSILVDLGYISEDQLATVLSQQKQSKDGKRVGELLVENNYLTQYELVQALSLHLGFPYVEPRLDTLDPSLLGKASKQFFLSHRLLPLGVQDGATKIAMADPLNSSAIDAAKLIFGSHLILAITIDKYIQEVLESYEESRGNKTVVESDKNEVVKLVDQIIHDAIAKGVSDIHIEPLKNRSRIRLRKDGSLIPHMDLPKHLHSSVVSRIKIMASANIAEKRRHQDGRILMGSNQTNEGLDIRVSFYVTIFGEKVVMRLLTKKAELFKVSDLGLGSKMLSRFTEEVLETPTGVVIITGPTGAGKTTTLYASINYCNKVDTNIVTAEEPVEYVIEGIAQCPIDPKIGLTFEETLRHILRQDPDIIILGEIRDKLSAESAIQAALTGHKVFTTFHTEDTIGGLLRLMNMDIETFLISSTVVCVVAQRLLKRVCPSCKKNYTVNARELRRLKYDSLSLRGYDFQLGEGCRDCDFTGYRGRVAVFELLVLNEYVKEAIRQHKTSYEIRRISVETSGLVTLVEDGLAKAAKGITSVPEVLRQLPILESPRPLDQILRLVGEF